MMKKMGKPNKDLSYKRISIGLSPELDKAVINLRMSEEYCRLSYADAIRVLILEGAKVIESRRQTGNAKS